MKGNDEDFSLEKLQELENISKARRWVILKINFILRYQFKVSELDSNINLKNYLIDKIENLGLQSTKSQISGKVDMFLNGVFHNHNTKAKSKSNYKTNNSNIFTHNFLDYDDKLARLHKLGIVNHRYKLPVTNIYERAHINSNFKGNNYTSKSSGPKIEFTDKRIPTPVSKNKPDFIKLRSWFMDSSIR